MHRKEYKPPTVTIDGVVFQLANDGLSVLLIKRAREPFKDLYALPGGYCPEGETTIEVLNRVLQTKAGVSKVQLSVVEQLATFDSVARDPRGHAISIVYIALGKNIIPHANEDTQEPQFFSVDALPKLAYDHKIIIEKAREWLRNRLIYTSVAGGLLAKSFTLSDLQTVYEAILGTPLDKRNFRKRILASDTLVETNDFTRDGAHRPARLYEFQMNPKVFI